MFSRLLWGLVCQRAVRTNRVIDLTPCRDDGLSTAAVLVLKTPRETWEAHRAFLRVSLTNEELVFSSPTGGPMVPNTLTHAFSEIARESSGVYWKPVYNLLEALDLTLLVINAQHIKAVLGRKTDVKDAVWIADLLRHGLPRGSFIPDLRQRELRELVRYRRSLFRQTEAEGTDHQRTLTHGHFIKHYPRIVKVACLYLSKTQRARILEHRAGITNGQDHQQ